MKKRILASLLTIVMLLGILPTAALAAPADEGVVITVRNAETGEPVGGALVELSYQDIWGRTVNGPSGRTDNAGKAIIKGAEVRTYSVQVTADGYENGSRTVKVWWNPIGYNTGSETISLRPVKDLTVVRFFVTGLNNPMYVLEGVRDANGELIGTEGAGLRGKLTVSPNYMIIYGEAPYYGQIVNKSDIGGDIENWAKSHLPNFQSVIAAIQKTIEDKKMMKSGAVLLSTLMNMTVLKSWVVMARTVGKEPTMWMCG